MKKVLYINACVRKESRTDILARELLKRLGFEYEEINIAKAPYSPLSEEKLFRRTELIEKGDYSDPMFDAAKTFAGADLVVIAAPYWDLSFPSALKNYIENIYVTGIVSRYGDDGMPVGMCRAEKLYYVTTAGGPYEPAYSFGYIKEMAEKFFGIKETELIAAEMLDIVGNDAQQILEDRIAAITL